ncbi:MAG TPA: hypothetical protein VGE97_09385 [Nitrososphaera sp.]
MATPQRIRSRRNEFRNGHSVKCYKMYTDGYSKNYSVCTCDKNNTAPKPTKKNVK